MKMRSGALVALVVLAPMLAGCGGPSKADKQVAEAFCASRDQGMNIDKYTNPEGFDRCVEDAAKVANCLGPSAQSYTSHWIPADCSNGGYMTTVP